MVYAGNGPLCIVANYLFGCVLGENLNADDLAISAGNIAMRQSNLLWGVIDSLRR